MRGGLSGFSTNEKARSNWTLTATSTATMTRSIMNMAGADDPDNWMHKDDTTSQLFRQEQQVRNVESIILRIGNPFKQPSDYITNLASGVQATEAVQKDLLLAWEKGSSRHHDFLKARILQQTVRIDDPMKKLSLKTFDSMGKSVKVQTRENKEVMIKSDLAVLSRLLVIALSREIDIREIMRYELGCVPRALARHDGTPTAAAKHLLRPALEDDIPPATDIPVDATWIVDAAAILHSITTVPTTYGDLSSLVFQIMTSHSNHSSRVDFVCDSYPDKSTKNPIKVQRSAEAGGEYVIKIKSSEQKILAHQWKKILSSGKSKEAMFRFFLEDWSSDAYKSRIRGRQIYISLGQVCHRISVYDDQVENNKVQELCSNHEEADTKLLLHAKHAADTGSRTVVIKSNDTDVMVICIASSSKLSCRLLLSTGSANNPHFVEINNVASNLGTDMCDAMIGFHAFTGCDQVSGFVGSAKNKARTFSKLKKCPESVKAMTELGNHEQTQGVLAEKCEKYICQIYDYPEETSADEVRVKQYLARPHATHLLAPTSDAARKHIMRANYQAMIWKNSLIAEPDLPSPNGNGWLEKEHDFEIDWGDLQPAPKGVLQFLHCGCKGACDTNRCSCCKHKLPCTSLCKCSSNCVNEDRNSKNNAT
jgi:hypothetical protein